jgi:hypothetical protein
MKYLVIFIAVNLLISKTIQSQTTNIVILDPLEIKNLRTTLENSKSAKILFDSILVEAQKANNQKPLPVEEIYYEGLLDNDPKRIRTVESFTDIEAVVSLIYANYGKENDEFGEKVKTYVLAWTKIYQPSGNPINENKLNALFWGYFLFQNHFNLKESKMVENWLLTIARKEMNREQTPNNNWEAKRLKIIGTIGCILNIEELKNHSIAGFRKYIETSYYADGTSNDLLTRDALHYHVSGLTPCISTFVNLSKLDKRFEMFSYVSHSGSSIKKSVEYVVPYVKGEIQRKEWMNSKVQLDKERAAAGLPEYQPGKLFEPVKAYPMFEWACYYNRDWYSVFENTNQEMHTTTWIGLLNSPLIRE